MNSLTIILMIIIGAVLVYASVKGEDPRSLIKRSLTKGGSGTVGPAGSGL